MKTTITIEDNNVRIMFAPESELERLSLSELGNDVSVSRWHQNLVLKPRGNYVCAIDDGNVRGIGVKES